MLPDQAIRVCRARFECCRVDAEAPDVGMRGDEVEAPVDLALGHCGDLLSSCELVTSKGERSTLQQPSWKGRVVGG